MAPKFTNSLVPMRTLNKGFTIPELLVGLIMAGIISVVAFNLFEQTTASYSRDKSRVDTGQNLSGLLELVGNDIKQAGEQIGDARFPAIQISQNGSASTLTIRKAIGETLTLCTTIPKTGAGSAILSAGAADQDIVILDRAEAASTVCNPSTPDASSFRLPVVDGVTTLIDKLPPTLADWTEIRYRQPNNKGRIAIFNGSGHIHTFDYKTEAKVISPNEKYTVTINNCATGTTPCLQGLPDDTTNSPFNGYAKGNTIYLIEERTYRYDADSKELKLKVNGENEQTLITGVDRFEVKALINGASEPQITIPLKDDTKSYDNWKNIKGVQISLKLAKPSSGNITYNADDYESSGTFYPRNVMSK
jgi:prepilin-type N-terminal cleavage/methylation domain-containing protein